MLELAVPGRHNLQNALAAVAVGLELGVPFDRIAARPDRISRRRAALSDARRRVTASRSSTTTGTTRPKSPPCSRPRATASPSRIVAVFQPHRYTRTRDLLDEFGPALALADVVVLTDIYAAGEAPIPGVSLDALAASVRRSVQESARGRRLRPGCRRDRDVWRGRATSWSRWARDRSAHSPDRILRAIGAEEVRSMSGRRAARRGLPPAAAGVAAPADRRFRRPDVRPGTRKRIGLLALKLGKSRAVIAVMIVAGTWTTRAVLDSSLLTVKHIVVCGNTSSRRPRSRRCSTASRSERSCDVDFEVYRKRVMDSPWVADVSLRRVLPSTSRCASPSACRWRSRGSARSSTWSTAPA